MWLDLVLLAILAWFTLLGVWRGALAGGIGVASLALAYGAAIAAAWLGGEAAAQRLGLPGWSGPPLLGAGVFLATYAIAGGLGRVLTRRERERRVAGRSAVDRLVGGCFGCLRGGFVVLLLGLAAIWLDALGVVGERTLVPSTAASRSAAWTAAAVERGVASALGGAGEGGRVVARLAARPGESLTALQAVLESPGIAALQADAGFWSLVETGHVDSALHRASFLAVRDDAALRAELAHLGVVEPAAAADPRLFGDAMAEILRELGPRLRDLREDPELARLMRDPEVVALAQQGDTLALLAHPGFREFVVTAAGR